MKTKIFLVAFLATIMSVSVFADPTSNADANAGAAATANPVQNANTSSLAFSSSNPVVSPTTASSAIANGGQGGQAVANGGNQTSTLNNTTSATTGNQYQLLNPTTTFNQTIKSTPPIMMPNAGAQTGTTVIPGPHQVTLAENLEPTLELLRIISGMSSNSEEVIHVSQLASKRADTNHSDDCNGWFSGWFSDCNDGVADMAFIPAADYYTLIPSEQGTPLESFSHTRNTLSYLLTRPDTERYYFVGTAVALVKKDNKNPELVNSEELTTALMRLVSLDQKITGFANVQVFLVSKSLTTYCATNVETGGWNITPSLSMAKTLGGAGLGVAGMGSIGESTGSSSTSCRLGVSLIFAARSPNRVGGGDWPRQMRILTQNQAPVESVQKSAAANVTVSVVNNMPQPTPRVYAQPQHRVVKHRSPSCAPSVPVCPTR